jgi:hypothetical protein
VSALSTPDTLDVRGVRPLLIRATGHGADKRAGWTDMASHAPVRKAPAPSHGFRTGDLVRASVTTGTKVGTYTGRVAVRASGSFNITTAGGTVQGLHHRFFRLLQRGDGYSYATQPTPSPRAEAR